jgi:hypothetical protein
MVKLCRVKKKNKVERWKEKKGKKEKKNMQNKQRGKIMRLKNIQVGTMFLQYLKFIVLRLNSRYMIDERMFWPQMKTCF